MYYFIYFLLQFSWGIIQNILGLFILIVLLIKRDIRKIYFYHGSLVAEWRIYSSMAMGMFVFFGHYRHTERDKFLAHEYGHTIQSAVLGPLYLPVVGLPSFMWAKSKKNRKYREDNRVSYFDYYTEKWANSWAEKVLNEETPD